MTEKGHLRDVKSAYDRWASTYDSDVNATRDLNGAVLRGQGFDLAGLDVVECGCGTGLNTVWLAERARSVMALDFSEGMLERARERVHSPNVRFIRHDVREPWPLPDGSADLVIGNLVLEHVDTLQPVFHEARRVLRFGGGLFLCELHPFRQMRGDQARFFDEATGQMVLIDAFRHDVSEYVNAALEAGFRLIQLREWRDEGATREAAPRLLSARFE